MKKLLLYATFLPSLLLASNQPNIIIPPVTINVNLPHNNVSQTTSLASIVQQETTVETSQETNVNVQLQDYQAHAQHAFSWFIEHPWKTTFGVSCCLYAYIWYNLIQLTHSIHANSSWSNWKQHMSLTEILATSQKLLTDDLLLAVQQRYTYTGAIDDFFGPLMFFFNTIDSELHQLKTLQTILRRIRILRLTKLFPWYMQRPEDIQEKIDRITYLKTILMTWVSQYKITRAQVN